MFQGSCFQSGTFLAACVQPQKQHIGGGFPYKALGSGSCLPSTDVLALKISSWESQLLFISFQMEC